MLQLRASPHLFGRVGHLLGLTLEKTTPEELRQTNTHLLPIQYYSNVIIDTHNDIHGLLQPSTQGNYTNKQITPGHLV